MEKLSSFIDHTLLKPTATEMDFRKLCEEIYQNNFFLACVPPFYVSFVKELLAFSDAKIGTVVGFPFGNQQKSVKIFETKEALKDGADEIDLVMNLNAFKSMAFVSVKEEISSICKMVHDSGKSIKVIIETAYLDNFDMRIACEICTESEVDFVKTSTGYAPKGADLGQVKYLRKLLPDSIGIKASGGIQHYEQAIAFIEAGAARIGTSAGVQILEEYRQSNTLF